MALFSEPLGLSDGLRNEDEKRPEERKVKEREKEKVAAFSRHSELRKAALYRESD